MKDKPARTRRGWCAEGCGKRGNAQDKTGRWHCWHHAAEVGLLSVKKLTPFTTGAATGRMTTVAQEGRVKKEKPSA